MNCKYRIVAFDGDRHDRELLALVLRSSDPGLEVLEAATPLEVAHHLSGGLIDVLIADPADNFAATAEIASEIRRRTPQSLFWLFTSDLASPHPRACVGHGVDGRTEKTSAGFLNLPAALLERLRSARELRMRVPLDADAVFSSVFAIPACLLARGGVMAAVNRELEELLERPRYELLDLPFEQVIADPERQDEWRRRLLATRERWDTSGNLRITAARHLNVALTANPLGDAATGGGLWAVSVQDASHLAVISSLPAPAAGVNECDFDNVLFAVSHDLQAPLNSLASHARVLAETTEPEGLEARVAVKEVGALAARMQLMVDGMLQVASVRANPREPEVVNLDAVLQDAMENLRSEIDQTGATIERHPLPTLLVNRLQLVHVFQNLLANALKFRGNRVPRVRVSAEENGDSVRILFEDNGIGMEARDIERIFGMFQRLHNEREYPGIGVGLAICRQIVRAHGGDIFVESAPGRGSCFIIEFKGAALRSVINRGPRNGIAGQ